MGSTARDSSTQLAAPDNEAAAAAAPLQAPLSELAPAQAPLAQPAPSLEDGIPSDRRRRLLQQAGGANSGTADGASWAQSRDAPRVLPRYKSLDERPAQPFAGSPGPAVIANPTAARWEILPARVILSMNCTVIIPKHQFQVAVHAMLTHMKAICALAPCC
jgi:hypothetical protein